MVGSGEVVLVLFGLAGVFADEVGTVSAEGFGVDGFVGLDPGFELLVGGEGAGLLGELVLEFVLEEVPGGLGAAGGDDGEGEVGDDVEELLAELVFLGHAVFVPGDPCEGFGVEAGFRGVVVGVPAVEGDAGYCGEVGGAVGEALVLDVLVELLVFLEGEVGVCVSFHGCDGLPVGGERGAGSDGGVCAFDGRGLVWLFVFVFCCCFSTTIIIYIYTINDKYVTREGFTEHILPGDEGVRDFFPVMFFCFGCVAFRSPLFAPVFPGRVFVFLSGFFCFFESVRLWCSSCCDFFRVHSVFSALGRCVLCGSLLCAAGRVCVCPSFGSRLPCPRESGVASVPQRLCSVVSVRTYLGRVQMVLRPTGAVPGVCGSGPRGCADGSCLMVDSMAVVIYESAPVVVAGCDQVLFRVIKLPVAEGLFQKQVRLHPKMRGCPGVTPFQQERQRYAKVCADNRAELKTKISKIRGERIAVCRTYWSRLSYFNPDCLIR